MGAEHCGETATNAYLQVNQTIKRGEGHSKLNVEMTFFWKIEFSDIHIEDALVFPFPIHFSYGFCQNDGESTHYALRSYHFDSIF